MNEDSYHWNVFSIYFLTMVFSSKLNLELSPDETFPEFPIWVLEFSDDAGNYGSVTVHYHEDASFWFQIAGFSPYSDEVDQVIFIWECRYPYMASLI